MSASQLPTIDFLPDIDDATLQDYLGRSFNASYNFNGSVPQPYARNKPMLNGLPSTASFDFDPTIHNTHLLQPCMSPSAGIVKPEPCHTHTSSADPSGGSGNAIVDRHRKERRAKSQARAEIRAVVQEAGLEQATTNSTALGSDGSRSASEAENSRPARGRARRTGKGPKDAKKVAALQEKNRRAQRRFRERQKQRVAELEEKVAELEQQIGNLQVDKANLVTRNGILEKVVTMNGDKMQRLQSFVKCTSRKESAEYAADELVSAFEDQLVLTLRPVPITLTAEDMRAMNPEQMTAYWKEYVQQLGSALLAAGQHPDGPGAQRIEQLTKELCKLVMRVALLSPTLIKQFLLAPAQGEACTVLPPVKGSHTLWPAVLASMNLSQQQKLDMVRLRRLFLAKLYKIVSERVEINKRLASALPPGTGNHDAAYQYLKATEAIKRLRTNLREEHVLVLDFVTTLFQHILTPYQMARGIVQCYPIIPDCLALCTWVAAEAREPDALQAMHTGRNPQIPQGRLPSVHTLTGASPPIDERGMAALPGQMGSGVLSEQEAGRSSGGAAVQHTQGRQGEQYDACMASGPSSSVVSPLPSTVSPRPSTAASPHAAGGGQPAGSRHAVSNIGRQDMEHGDRQAYHTAASAGPGLGSEQAQALAGQEGRQDSQDPFGFTETAGFVPFTLYSEQLLHQLPTMDVNMLPSAALDGYPSLAQRFSQGPPSGSQGPTTSQGRAAFPAGAQDGSGVPQVSQGYGAFSQRPIAASELPPASQGYGVLPQRPVPISEGLPSSQGYAVQGSSQLASLSSFPPYVSVGGDGAGSMELLDSLFNSSFDAMDNGGVGVLASGIDR